MSGSQRIGIVTGASRGIGRAIALALARDGVHVVGIARSSEALSPVAREIEDRGGDFTPIALDLGKAEAAMSLADRVAERWERLDVLVGNAAILGPLAAVAALNQGDLERVLATNLVANAALLSALDPMLLKSAAGRALFMTAGAPREPFANVGAYAASKAGLEALVKTYALERQASAVKANLFNPGPVRTDMRAEAVPGDDADRLPIPDDLTPHILAMLSADFQRTGTLFDYPTRRII